MLGDIRRVTVAATDLDAVEHAYGKFLGYRVVARGSVSEAEARAWGAEKMAGGPDNQGRHGPPARLFAKVPVHRGLSPPNSLDITSTIEYTKAHRSLTGDHF